jgi:hypothetical protein
MDPCSLDELNNIGIKEVLEQDPRPTFILDLDPDDLSTVSVEGDLKLLFCNESLRSHHLLLDSIVGGSDDTNRLSTDQKASTGFRAWAISITKFDDTKDVFPLTYTYRGMLWTGLTVQKRWRLISGNQCFTTPYGPPTDLSIGPPGEVATGGYRIEQGSQRDTNGTTHMSQDASQISNLQSFVSHRTPNGINADGKAASATLVSERQYSSAMKQSRFSSRSSDGTANTRSSISLSLSAPENGVPDWTVANPKGVLSEHIIFTRSIDWGSTPLVSRHKRNCSIIHSRMKG